MASPVIDRSGDNAMNTQQPRIEYIEARRALLDALTALQPHVDAFVLIGAQAVYLRTAGRLPGYQPFTTDADLALDPSRLADFPLLADAMLAEGFEYSGEPGIWNRHMLRPGFSEDIIVPVDLIVPAHVAASAGRRGARLPGDHGRTAARKSAGVEGALVDHDPIEIASLESSEARRMIVNVAGPAALLVAKVHKLGERLATPHRLIDKDAGDVFRLFEATPPTRDDSRDADAARRRTIIRRSHGRNRLREATVLDTPFARCPTRRASPCHRCRPGDRDNHHDGIHKGPARSASAIRVVNRVVGQSHLARTPSAFRETVQHRRDLSAGTSRPALRTCAGPPLVVSRAIPCAASCA